jgi:hypothetical protein
MRHGATSRVAVGVAWVRWAGGPLDGEEYIVHRLVKRVTACKLMNHKWAKVPYQQGGGTGYFLRCLHCDKEMHNVQAPGARVPLVERPLE